MSPPSSFILGSWHPSIKRAQKGDSSEVSSYSFCPPQFENQYSYLLHVYWAASLCQALCGCWDTMLSRSALQQYWLCSQTHCAMSYLLVFECVVRFFLNCPFCQDHRGELPCIVKKQLGQRLLSKAVLSSPASNHLHSLRSQGPLACALSSCWDPWGQYVFIGSAFHPQQWAPWGHRPCLIV